MDWSLVLVSQGIETVIENFDGDADGRDAGRGPASEKSGRGSNWGLVVPAHDYERAISAIRQYRHENRGWPWQQEVWRPGFLFDWGSLAWAVLLVIFYWLDARFDLRQPGLMDSAAVAHGEWWRWFTAMWLHADLAHLANNATFGLVLLGLTMGRYGTGAGLLAAYLAGAGGNLVSGVLSAQPHHSLGASGMVMGALGLLAVQSFSLWRKTPHAAKFIISGIVGGVMLFVLFGLGAGTDITAHLAGLVGGLVLGSVLSRIPSLAQKPRINLFGGLAFALLVIIPWWQALRHI